MLPFVYLLKSDTVDVLFMIAAEFSFVGIPISTVVSTLLCFSAIVYDSDVALNGAHSLTRSQTWAEWVLYSWIATFIAMFQIDNYDMLDDWDYYR